EVLKSRVDDRRYPLPAIPKGDADKAKTLVVPMGQSTKSVSMASPHGDAMREESNRRRVDVSGVIKTSD
ncbi:type IV secretory system conjugative DNA transfer family protein, partial [Klebsiella pneumoniae]